MMKPNIRGDIRCPLGQIMHECTWPETGMTLFFFKHRTHLPPDTLLPTGSPPSPQAPGSCSSPHTSSPAWLIS